MLEILGRGLSDRCDEAHGANVTMQNAIPYTAMRDVQLFTLSRGEELASFFVDLGKGQPLRIVARIDENTGEFRG